ncbi:hypothetical protein BN137_3502 [Cronobacter condimenti 1330]|uniref:Uncharacterized protein n=1 Tax=Cronobacter condimenti 1330 TaxID=1073999 RepID=K8AEB0_9ENTR|nr:hypothetical protein BN137_3502 [Cronobacter condimenti 1330]
MAIKQKNGGCASHTRPVFFNVIAYLPPGGSPTGRSSNASL